MPTVYTPRPLQDLIREEKERMERPEDVEYVPESEALIELLSEEALERLERKREDYE